MRDYVEEQVANGSYSTISEYFRELVRVIHSARDIEAILDDLSESNWENADDRLYRECAIAVRYKSRSFHVTSIFEPSVALFAVAAVSIGTVKAASSL